MTVPEAASPVPSVPPGRPPAPPAPPAWSVAPGTGTGPATGVGPGAGPLTALPRPPGSLALAVAEFWRERGRVAPVTTLVTCGVVGIAGAVLLVGHRLGLGAALVGLAVWAAAVPALVRRRAVGDLVTASLAVALVGMVAVRDAGWVVALCVATAAGVTAVAATSARSAPAVLLSGASWVAGAFRALPWVGRGIGNLAGTRRGQVLGALRSVAITVVLLTVFGLLFASADKVFASYLPHLDADLLPGQVVVGLLVAVVVATLAHLALAPPGWSNLRPAPGRPARRGEWLLPVLALDAMVLAFVLVQVGGLVDGHGHILETVGLTYAQYAREGFAQLVVATALTLAVVAVAARRAPRESERARMISRTALGFLCVGTLGVVGSALRRMDLYVEAFGMTRLRLFVVVVEVALAAVLLLVMVAGVRWRGGWLPRAVVQVVGVAVLGLALANPDALIVRYNTPADLDIALDVSYLQGLSADAVPAIERLAEPLRSCVLEAVVVDPSAGLADWNLSRAQADRALTAGAPIGTQVGSACARYDVSGR